MTSSRMPVFLMITLLIAGGSRMSLGSPVPDASEIGEHGWADSLKNVFNSAKDTVKSGLDSASDKLSKLGKDIKNSDTYEKVTGELQNVGEKITKVGDNIKESDTFQNVKNTFSKAAENIKDKLD